jgi:hypothetical protein
MRWSVPKASILPGIVLISLVLGVFFSLQNYGPQSTVRKFHATLKRMYDSQTSGQALKKADWEELQSLMIDDIGTSETMSVGSPAGMAIRFVYTQYQANNSFRLIRTTRREREVIAAVAYGRSGQPPIAWVVVKPVGSRQWKISAQKTLDAQ